MQRREFVREPSKSARWSLPPALLSLALAVVGTLAHWSDVLSTPNLILVLATSVTLGLAGFVLGLMGFRALWNRAAIGGRRSTYAMILASPVLIIGLSALWLSQRTPLLSDITTDLVDPPHFKVLAEDPTLAARHEPPRIDAAKQSAAYKGVTGRRYALSADTIVATAIEQLKNEGWQLVSDRPTYLGNGEWTIEAISRSALFGFRDDIVVRVTDEGEATYVDMRAAARFGEADLGSNAAKIMLFMANLDQRVSLGGGIKP